MHPFPMHNMKKILLVFLTATLLLLFTGCVNLNATYGINAEYTAFLRYEIHFDLTDYPEQQVQLKILIKDFIGQYRSKGFTVKENVDESTDIVDVTLEYSLAGKTQEQAFDNLKKILTDKELTPFTKVKMDSETTKLEQAFSVELEADFSGIISEENLQEFMPSMREKFTDSLEAATGQLTLQLPGDEIESASGGTDECSDGFCQLTADIDKDVPFVVSLQTRLEINDNEELQKLRDSMEQSQQMLGEYQQKLRILYIAMAGLAVLAILLIIWLIFVHKKRKRLLADAAAQEENK